LKQSSLPVRRTLAQLGISRAAFYRWDQRYLARGAVALQDRQPAPRRVWNKLPEMVMAAVIDLALMEPELPPRELAEGDARVTVEIELAAILSRSKDRVGLRGGRRHEEE